MRIALEPSALRAKSRSSTAPHSLANMGTREPVRLDAGAARGRRSVRASARERAAPTDLVAVLLELARARVALVHLRGRGAGSRRARARRALTRNILEERTRARSRARTQSCSSFDLPSPPRLGHEQLSGTVAHVLHARARQLIEWPQPRARPRHESTCPDLREAHGLERGREGRRESARGGGESPLPSIPRAREREKDGAADARARTRARARACRGVRCRRRCAAAGLRRVRVDELPAGSASRRDRARDRRLARLVVHRERVAKVGEDVRERPARARR